MSNDAINAELPKLEQTALLTFWVLDGSDIGGSLFRFFGGTDELNRPIVWQGNTYTPLPVQASGFEFRGQGSPPRPTLVFGNIGGQFSALALAYDDLIGARVIRKRTFARFLDGQPDADSTQSFPDDIFYIERKVSETKAAIEFELGTAMDVDGVSLPKRVMHQNLCAWKYRGDGCGFAQNTVIATVDDATPGIELTDRGEWDEATTYEVGDFVTLPGLNGAVHWYWCYADGGAGIVGQAASPSNATFWKRDTCGKRVRSCSLRFGSDPDGLPFGGFPGTDKL